MIIDIIRKENQIVSNWSGGKTTQLMIYPRDSSYIKRNFQWRLSSAAVEVENSTFTQLPGVSRIIMIIKGKIQLEHIGHYKKVLNEYDQDSFDGGWTTISYGKVTDFNLMLKDNFYGTLNKLTINMLEEIEIMSFRENYEIKTDAFYCTVGKVEFNIDDQTYIINEGDIIVISYKDDMQHKIKIKNSIRISSILIHSKILGTVNKLIKENIINDI